MDHLNRMNEIMDKYLKTGEIDDEQEFDNYFVNHDFQHKHIDLDPPSLVRDGIEEERRYKYERLQSSIDWNYMEYGVKTYGDI